MELVRARVDTWVPLGTTGYELLVGVDALTDPAYCVRAETTYYGGLHLRTRAPLPAGLWVRPIGRRDLWVPPEDRYTTEEFRRDTGDRL